MNIIDAFLLHAKHQPTAPAICAPGRKIDLISYGRLAACANNIAARALANGFKRGDVVAIFVGDPIFHWALILGLTRLGIVSLSTIDPILPAEFRIDAVLTDTAVQFRNASRVIQVDPDWLNGEGMPPAAAHEESGSELARIILTSGTTGDQKAVAMSHDLILRRIQTYDFAFGNRFATCSRLFLDVGVAANSGYLWMIYMLARGGTVFVRGSDPAETMQALSLHNVQAMVASPAGMAEFLDYYERSPAFLCPFEVLLSVGSKLALSLSERVRKRMCPLVVHGYGATEGNPVAGAYVHQLEHIKGAVGYITPGMIVEAADDAGRPLKPGDEGHIRFRGDRCVSGYFGDPPDTNRFFRDGWFYPGDTGAVTANGVLVISGRSKSIIDLGGDKINPEIIEAALLSYPGVVHAVAFGRANALGIEEIWAVVESAADIDSELVRGHCAKRLNKELVPVRVLRVARMPRNAGDKIERHQAIALAQSG